jgi:hypothetical protein
MLNFRRMSSSLTLRLLFVPAILILIIGSLWRVRDLTTIPAINGDEAFPTVQMAELTWGRRVQLWVPTQRILSPIYAGLVLFTQRIRPNLDLLTIRLPATIAGFLLVGLCFFLLKPSLGAYAAGLATLLVTALPMNIAYSRSAVEQCLMGAVGLFALSCALRGQVQSTFWAYAIAVLSHPVNVFLAPLLVFPLAVHLKEKRRELFLFIGGLTLIVLLLLFSLPQEYGYLNILSVSKYLLTRPGSGILALGYFLRSTVRLFTGTTAYEYFISPPSPQWIGLTDFLGSFLILCLLFFGTRVLIRQKQWLAVSFIAGFFVMLGLLFFIGGPRVVTPGLSRHANILPVPFVIVFALLLRALATSERKKAGILAGVIFLCSILLWQFRENYFVEAKRSGGGFTHRTYAVGPVEPKVACLDWILSATLANRSGGKTVKIVAEDWWIYWPVKYLTLATKNVDVVFLDETVSQAEFYRWFKEGSYTIAFTKGKVTEYLETLYSPEAVKGMFAYKAPSYSPHWVLGVLQFRG